MRRIITASMILIATLFFFSPTQAAPQLRGVGVYEIDSTGSKSGRIHLYDKMTAVIIGIDRYENLSSTQWLKYAEKDARGIEKVLRENYPFDQVITLYNEQALCGRPRITVEI